MRNLLLGFVVSLPLIACSSTGVIPMSDGVFFVSKRSAQVGFGPPDGTKADVYLEANEFCAQKSKVMQQVDLKVTNSGFARPGNVSLEFRCVDKAIQ